MDILITDFGWQLSANTGNQSDLQPFILLHFWAYYNFTDIIVVTNIYILALLVANAKVWAKVSDSQSNYQLSTRSIMDGFVCVCKCLKVGEGEDATLLKMLSSA